MEIRRINETEVDQIEWLFQEVYNKPQGVEYWKWCFQAPYGYIAMGTFDKGYLVSYYASVLLEKGAITYSSMTHPDYQGNGLYWNLALGMYDELKKYRDWSYCYSNEKIHSLHKKMGGIERCQVKEYRIPFDNKNIDMNVFIGDFYPHFRFWRFQKHPIKYYLRFWNHVKFNDFVIVNRYKDRIQLLDYSDIEFAIQLIKSMKFRNPSPKIISFWSEQDLDYPYVLIPQWKIYRNLNDIDIEKVMENDPIRMYQHDQF